MVNSHSHTSKYIFSHAYDVPQGRFQKTHENECANIKDIVDWWPFEKGPFLDHFFKVRIEKNSSHFACIKDTFYLPTLKVIQFLRSAYI